MADRFGGWHSRAIERRNQGSNMFSKIEALHQANTTATPEQLSKALQAETGMTIRECREWVKAWILK
jgi:hypothetical protein